MARPYKDKVDAELYAELFPESTDMILGKAYNNDLENRKKLLVEKLKSTRKNNREFCALCFFLKIYNIKCANKCTYEKAIEQYIEEPYGYYDETKFKSLPYLYNEIKKVRHKSLYKKLLNAFKEEFPNPNIPHKNLLVALSLHLSECLDDNSMAFARKASN